MKAIISRFEHDISWLEDYPELEVVLYDRSDETYRGKNDMIKVIHAVPNIGTDIFDKFTYIIDNYDNLPDVALYTKANLFKYISREEFNRVKDNKTFTPLLTSKHEEKMGTSYYKDGMYYEVNNGWYLMEHPVRTADRVNTLMDLLGIKGMRYVPFAPGSNYILPKENILKHTKDKYEQMRRMLEWTVYPGEAQIIERGLYTLWQ